jgi:hypothetical protein
LGVPSLDGKETAVELAKKTPSWFQPQLTFTNKGFHLPIPGGFPEEVTLVVIRHMTKNPKTQR